MPISPPKMNFNRIMSTFQEYKESIRKIIRELTAQESFKKVQKEPKTVIIDVRDTENWNELHIPGAIHIPRGLLELKIEEHIPDKNTPIICHCGGGTRSLLSAKSLKEMGYTDAYSMAGGFREWKEAGFPTESSYGLTTEEKRRYEGHFNIPEVGEEGQRKLKKAKVLLVGAGGLGSPAAYYLTAAGIGTLGIVDFDKVETSNLHRQILHSVMDIGKTKTESAKEKLLRLNPNIHVETYAVKLTKENVEEILKPYDVIVDGSDNFPTRYLINDACLRLKKPNAHGSIYRFEGQVSVFCTEGGPCYRCLFPEPPPPEVAPSCAEAGVLGVLPGVIGTLQAVETIKWILGKGESLAGRLICYDALKGSFKELKLKRNPTCLLHL